MSIELGRRLLASGAISSTRLQAALFVHATQRVPFVQALLSAADLDSASLERELEDAAIPVVFHPIPARQVVARLPDGLCQLLMAVPVRVDPITGTIDVAVADPHDSHIQNEFAFHLGAPIRILRAPLPAMRSAIDQLARPEASPAMATPASRRGSDVPIPLVRRSQLRNEELGAEDMLEGGDADGIGRTTREVFIIDPAKVGPNSGQPPVELVASYTLHVQAAVDAIGRAHTRDEVVAAIIGGMLTVARRVGVLAARKDDFIGWSCSPSLTDDASFRAVRVSRAQPTICSRAEAEGYFLGPVPLSSQHAGLYACFDDPATEVCVHPVRVGPKAVLLIVADGLVDTMIATRTAEKIARAAAHCLTQLLRAEKPSNR